VNLAWPVLEKSIWAGVAALGFAILFNVPPRVLWACALSGSTAFAARAGLIGLHFSSLELSTLYGATLTSLLGLLWAKRFQAPALLFVIPAVIPFVPGALAFRTIKDLMVLTSQARPDPELLASVVANGFKTVLVVGSIALGVALPSLVVPRRKDPSR
jgi:uncharacterized membrane protein YjjB (DUF3815 family)